MAHALHDLRASRARAATPPTESLRVLIAEGQGIVRAGVRALLDRQDGMIVTAVAATSEEAEAAARETRPDVVLMDHDLPDAGGISAARRILADDPHATSAVVMLMTYESDEAVFGALRAGATGLLLRDADPADLVAAVRAAADGDAVLAPAIARRVVADFLARPMRPSCTPERLKELTDREREVMALVAFGLSNDEIAERLVVARSTAKTHVSRALCKLHARDRAQLVVLAYEAGLVRPGTPTEDAARVAAGRHRNASEVARFGLRPVAA